jgi:ribosomal protein L23
MLISVAGANATMSKDWVSAQVAKEFGVKVLDVNAGTADGKAVFIVKIMCLGGDFKTAFHVNT